MNVKHLSNDCYLPACHKCEFSLSLASPFPDGGSARQVERNESSGGDTPWESSAEEMEAIPELA